MNNNYKWKYILLSLAIGFGISFSPLRDSKLAEILVILSGGR